MKSKLFLPFHYSSFIILFFLLLFLFSLASATALSDAANLAQPGTWREVVTTNANSVIGSSGSSNLPYSDDITYDPNSERLYYVGGDHCKLSQFISYDEKTSNWQIMPHPSWLTTSSDYCNGVQHGYDNGAIDQVKGFYYHARSQRLNRYNTATQVWSATPSLPSGDPHSGYNGVEVFPELGGVVYVDGANGFPAKVYLYKESTNQWTTLASGLAAGATFQYAEYNPVHHVMVFTVSSSFYKLSSTGQVSPLKAPPFSIYNGSGYVGVLTVDPVSGLYLVLTPDTRVLYTYDVLTDTWKQPSSPGKPNMANNGVVATPLSRYGVTLFTACTSTCHVYVYKSPGTGTAHVRAVEEAGLQISPNPFRGRATLRIPQGLAEDGAEVALFSADGKKIRLLKAEGASLSEGFTMDTAQLPAGLYLCRVKAGNSTLVKKIVVEN